MSTPGPGPVPPVLGDRPIPAPSPAPVPRSDQVVYLADVSSLMARRQTELLVFVGAIVVALVALGISPYASVSTAFAAGLAAIELRRRSTRR